VQCNIAVSTEKQLTVSQAYELPIQQYSISERHELQKYQTIGSHLQKLCSRSKVLASHTLLSSQQYSFRPDSQTTINCTPLTVTSQIKHANAANDYDANWRHLETCPWWHPPDEKLFRGTIWPSDKLHSHH